MTDDTSHANLPLRTLHDFLLEINDEWSRFRRGSLLSIIITILLFILFMPRYFIQTLISLNRFDTILAFGIIIALIYSVYLAYRQYRFYQRWERRIGLLLHIEENLLES